MKIAILTMFNGLSNTYSLVNVVAEQLQMLLNDDIKVKMLVSQHCPDSERMGIFADERIEWIKVVNSIDGVLFNWKTYTKATDVIEKDFYKQVEVISLDYIKYLSDCDVCLMHDILYQGAHLLHNVAIRRAQTKLPNVKFLAFTHSAPTTHIDAPYPISCMYSPMPNTTFVYPTKCGLADIAKQYDTTLDNCAVVNNSISPLLCLSDETKKIVAQRDFCDREVLVVYPARLNMSKRFHIIAEFVGCIKSYFKVSVGIIFCDFASADISPQMYKHIVKDLGVKAGLDIDDILFTSDLGFNNGVNRQTVLELFTLSNLYVCPSYSESFGLTVIEAASRGNFLVLNEAVAALKEVGESLNAYFMRWSAKNGDDFTTETYLPSKTAYYIDHARKILDAMQGDAVINAKTKTRIRYSSKWIYDNQLKPLLLKKAVATVTVCRQNKYTTIGQLRND